MGATKRASGRRPGSAMRRWLCFPCGGPVALAGPFLATWSTREHRHHHAGRHATAFRVRHVANADRGVRVSRRPPVRGPARPRSCWISEPTDPRASAPARPLRSLRRGTPEACPTSGVRRAWPSIPAGSSRTRHRRWRSLPCVRRARDAPGVSAGRPGYRAGEGVVSWEVVHPSWTTVWRIGGSTGRARLVRCRAGGP